MKKILPLILLLGCSSPKEECIDCIDNPVDSTIVTHMDSLIMENDSLIHKIQEQLEKTVVLEKNVKTTITKGRKLRKENRKLKKRIKKTNKSMDSLKKEIEVMKKMMPGKKNFFQKVLNIDVDSIEVVDTIIKD